MNLKQLIDDNMAVLDAESEHQEVLAEQKLERQHKALKELQDDIQSVVKEAGYNIALCKTAKHHAKKHRSHDDGNRYSEEIVCLLKIEFEERDDVDKQIYLELCGTKDMIVKRLAVVLANVMRLERNFNAALERGAKNE